MNLHSIVLSASSLAFASVTSCASTTVPLGGSDAGAEAEASVICTGICSIETGCTGGRRQTGSGRCMGGTFVCDTVACASDAGTE
ncbi:MAG: hypothetical protein WCJ30_09105 [Deltaproteobacteria bacterium]